MPSFSSIRDLWRNTDEMPWLMRILCQGAMVAGPILALATLVPGLHWNVNGRAMTYGEVWASGIGAAVFVSMLLVTIGAWGAAARVQNSRWAIVVYPLTMAPIWLVRGAPDGVSPAVGLSSMSVTAAILFFCLFRLSAVRRYFEDGPSNNRWRGP